MARTQAVNDVQPGPIAYVKKQEDDVPKIETPSEMFAANVKVMQEAKRAGVDGSLQYAMHIAIAMIRSGQLNPIQQKQMVAQIHAMAKTINTQNPFEGFGLPNGNGANATQTVQ